MTPKQNDNDEPEDDRTVEDFPLEQMETEEKTFDEQSGLSSSELYEEMETAFPNLSPTEEELGTEYRKQQVQFMIGQLSNFTDMPSWDVALYQAQETEMFEALVEALTQTLQVTRTQTFETIDELIDLCEAVLGMCEAITPSLVAVCAVKLYIKHNRPS